MSLLLISSPPSSFSLISSFSQVISLLLISFHLSPSHFISLILISSLSFSFHLSPSHSIFFSFHLSHLIFLSFHLLLIPSLPSSFSLISSFSSSFYHSEYIQECFIMQTRNNTAGRLISKYLQREVSKEF